jgi:hypothetical protein
MTRSDLLKVFATEGGLSWSTQRTYVYRQCPYIKVDVKFELEERGQPVDWLIQLTIRAARRPRYVWAWILHRACEIAPIICPNSTRAGSRELF